MNMTGNERERLLAAARYYRVQVQPYEQGMVEDQVRALAALLDGIAERHRPMERVHGLRVAL